MENKKLLKLNSFINKAYECLSFQEFLKLAIMNLHELIMYDSGIFYCALSRGSSYFKPYISGSIENCYKKQRFDEIDEFLKDNEKNCTDSEAFVYKSQDYLHGTIQVSPEPRSLFLSDQNAFHIACVRIVCKGQFMGEIYLHRGMEKPDFDDDDMFLLRLLQPHIAAMLCTIHKVTAVRYLEADNIPGCNTGICIFDGDMSLTGGNLAGVELLKTFTVYGSSILYHLKEMCADILNGVVAGEGKVFHDTRLLKTHSGDIKVEIFTRQKKGLNGKLLHVAIMQHCDENQLSADYKFKFTKREADIIDGLIQGKNNAQISDSLNISENTVKTHIKSIYKKTGTGNRTELTYMLMLNNE